MTDNNNLFILAVKAKLRFHTRGGLLSVEDLFDLPLTALDRLAVELDQRLANTSTKTFLANPDRVVTQAVKDDELRLEILKLVITTKQVENALKREAADKRARLDFLRKLKDKKRVDALESLSEAEIDAELAALEGRSVEGVETSPTPEEVSPEADDTPSEDQPLTP